MALKLDNALIDELGLGSLPEQEKQLLLRQIYEKLEMNVGVRLADQMSNEQLDEFEKFVDANDDKGAFQWLETNFPNYKDVVNEEFEKLKVEIKQYAPQMLAIARQNASQAAGAPQQGPTSMPGQGVPAGAQSGQYPPQYGNPAAQPQPYQPGPQYNPAAQPGSNGGYGQPAGPVGPAPGANPYYQAQPQQPFYGQPQVDPAGAGQQFQQPYPQAYPPQDPSQAQQAQPQYPPYPPQQPPAGSDQQAA